MSDITACDITHSILSQRRAIHAVPEHLPEILYFLLMIVVFLFAG